MLTRKGFQIVTVWFKQLVTGALLCNIYKCPYLRVPSSKALRLRGVFSLHLRLAALQGWKGGNAGKLKKALLGISWRVWPDMCHTFLILEYNVWTWRSRALKLHEKLMIQTAMTALGFERGTPIVLIAALQVTQTHRFLFLNCGLNWKKWESL